MVSDAPLSALNAPIKDHCLVLEHFGAHSGSCSVGPFSLQKSRHENSRCFTLRVLITPKNHEVSGRIAHAQFTRSAIPSVACTAVLYTKLQYGRSHAEVT